MPEGNAVSSADAADLAASYLPEVVKRACINFELFPRLEPEVASRVMIDAQSSLKVPGWAEAHVADRSMFISERRAHEDYADEQSRPRTASCYAFVLLTPRLALARQQWSTTSRSPSLLMPWGRFERDAEPLSGL